MFRGAGHVLVGLPARSRFGKRQAFQFSASEMLRWKSNSKLHHSVISISYQLLTLVVV
jgi:hypothetical protein